MFSKRILSLVRFYSISVFPMIVLPLPVILIYELIIRLWDLFAQSTGGNIQTI